MKLIAWLAYIDRVNDWTSTFWTLIGVAMILRTTVTVYDTEWPYLDILGSGGCDHVPETATFALHQRSMSIPVYSGLLLGCDPTPEADRLTG